MPPSDVSALQRAQFLATWWWYDPNHASEKCEAALAWELIRRTTSYRALSRKYQTVAKQLPNPTGDQILADDLQLYHFIQRAGQALGRPYADFLFGNFDPDHSWMKLDLGNRLKARGFIVWNGEAIQVNREYVLPRQRAILPRTGVGMIHLGRDGAGRLTVEPETLTSELLETAKTEPFEKMDLQAPGRYVFVHFDTRGTRAALLEAYDQAMLDWLRISPSESGKKVDRVKISSEGSKLAVQWDLKEEKDRSPVAFWIPVKSSAVTRTEPKEVALVPSKIPAFAFLMVAVKYNTKTVRGIFHNHLKRRKFDEWHQECVEFWKTLTIESQRFPRNPDGTNRLEVDKNGQFIREKVTRHVFDPRRHLPPAMKPTRSARRKDAWLGLGAYDVVADGRRLGKRSAQGSFLLNYCSGPDALRNAGRSMARYLRKLDKAAGRLDKNLAYWSAKSTHLKTAGAFQAMAAD